MSGQRPAREANWRFVREQALTFLREAEDAGRIEEAGITNFWLGLVAYWRGDFVQARTHYERGLGARDPNADPKVRDGFGEDRTWASAIFAVIMWQLGEVESVGGGYIEATEQKRAKRPSKV